MASTVMSNAVASGVGPAREAHVAPSKRDGASPELRTSCKECRRRKLKCDKRVPCTSCIKRGCSELCPDGVLPSKNANLEAAKDNLEARIQMLENILKEHNIPVPDSPPPPSAASPGVGPPRRQDSTAAGDEDWIPSFGTLVLGEAGRSRFVGPSAASEWLNQSSEVSQSAHELSGPSHGESSRSAQVAGYQAFPFGTLPKSSYDSLKTQLPSREDALSLIGYFYQLYAYNYDICREEQLMTYLAAFYPARPSQYSAKPWTNESHPHKLALIFITLAMGAMSNIDVEPPDMKTAAKYYQAAAACLNVVNFMHENTMACLQTLHIMVNYHLFEDRVKGGDSSWPIWGLSVRIIQAMGMHRDGQNWGLPDNILDERRRIFWETHAEDTFQSHCFGRPGGMATKHFDVEFPKEMEAVPWSTTKFRLVKVSNEILDQVMCAKPPPYSTILQLYQKIVAFEKTVPSSLKCQFAKSPSPSQRPDSRVSWADTPAAEKKAVRLAFQQHTLELNMSEMVMFLLRPFFARALHECPENPSKSKYGEAFLAITERCVTMISIAVSLHTLHRRAAVRQWFFWYHACSAAVCMASLVIVAPNSPLALLGWSQLQTACNLFSQVAHESKASMTSLALLLRLRQSASDKFCGVLSSDMPWADAKPEGQAKEEDEESAHLIGLHTRLIERMNRGVGQSKIVRNGSQRGGTPMVLPPMPHLPSASLPPSDSLSPVPFSAWSPPAGLDHYSPMFNYDLPQRLRNMPPNPLAGQDLLSPAQGQVPNALYDPEILGLAREQGVNNSRQAMDMDVDADAFSFLSTMWAAPVPESGPVYDRSVIGSNAAFTWEDLSATFGVDIFGQPPSVAGPSHGAGGEQKS